MNKTQTPLPKETHVDFKSLDKKNSHSESYTSAWNYRYVAGYNKKHPADQKR